MTSNNLILPTRKISAKQKKTLAACRDLLDQARKCDDSKMAAFHYFMAAARTIEELTPEVFASWDEAAQNIPAGDLWVPKIETREQSEGQWYWKDTEDDLSQWAGPFKSLETAAQAACESNEFTPLIYPDTEKLHRIPKAH